jgi:hypothetical protein
MGLLSGFLGHATEIPLDEVRKEMEPILVEGEQLVAAFKLVRDLMVFSDKRLILVDKIGVTGNKTDFTSIPYGKIVRFSKESAGMLDRDAELRIWLHGQDEPIKKEFRKDSNINGVYRLLGEGVLR